MSHDALLKEDSIKLAKEISKQIQEADKVFNCLPDLSRLKIASKYPLRVIDSEKMNYIVDHMVEINEKIYNFSRSTSQLSRKLQTLTMLCPADATYRVLYQVLAQIENKQMAITENYLKIKKNIIKLEKLKRMLDEIDDETEKMEIEFKIQKIQIQLSNIFSYFEAALKEIGFLLEAYEEIKSNKNIPDNWDEYDFEKAEIEAHIKGAFRNAIRDFIAHGRLSAGTCEWFEQLGISPFEATYEVANFIREANIRLSNNNPIDYDEYYDFLNDMAKKYNEYYKKACKRIGLSDNLISKRFTLIEPKQPSDNNINDI